MSGIARFGLALVLALSATPATAGTFNLIARLTVGTLTGWDFGYTVQGSATGVVSVGGGIAQVPAGIFPTSFSSPVSPPISGVNHITVTGGGLPAGTLDAGAATNVLPLQGTVHLLAGANPAGSMAQAPIGAGGTATALVLGIFDSTLSGSPWQLGAHTVTGTGDFGTEMFSGFDLRTALGMGVVQFVAPHTVFVPAFGTAASGSVLRLAYVPVAEPAALGMLGAAFLAAFARRLRSRGARDS